jgi:hypothetical protein
VFEREREREKEREILSTLKIFIDFHAIRCEPYVTEDRYHIELLVLNLLEEVPRKAVSTVTGLEWPRRFQEVKVPRFHDNGTEWW